MLHTVRYAILAAMLAAFLAPGLSPALAQSAAGLAVDPDAAPPSPEALALAKKLVAETDNGDIAAASWLAFPMARLMHELAIVKPEQSKAVLHDAIIPVLQKHAAELDDIQAKTYASVLTLDDLKGAVTFYATPAGKALVGMHGPLLQMNGASVAAWLETLKPEIAGKVATAQKAHGW